MTVHTERTDTTRTYAVPNYGTHIGELAARPGFRLGWAQLQDDGDEILYLYDADDGGFGYALNVDCNWCSEWGYAPFATEEPVCDHCGGPLDDDARTDDALQTLCGACIDADREQARRALRTPSARRTLNTWPSLSGLLPE